MCFEEIHKTKCVKSEQGRLKKKMADLVGKGQNKMIQANRQLKSCLGSWQTFLLG